jgi:phosphopantetheinyl transferase
VTVLAPNVHPVWPPHGFAAAPAPGRLPDGELHVWVARVDDPGPDVAMLDRAERARAARFREEAPGTRWANAHVLARQVLARYTGTSPARLVIRAGRRDKPVIRRPMSARWLRFNLSHAGELAVVVVARGAEVGVDVEAIRPLHDLLAVARRVLDDSVVRDLTRVGPEERTRRFFHAWVRHESRAKCLGTGLVEPTDDAREPVYCFDLDLGPGYAAAVSSAQPVGRIRRCHTTV